MNPSLAQLVRKWLRTYSTKSQWDFRYERDANKEDILSKGYLRMSKDALDFPCSAIKIEGDKATIGQFRRPPWGGLSQWTNSIHSDIKLIAADPRFFSKLDKVMQFLTREDQRRVESEKKFAQEEIARLKDILR